MWFTRRVYVVHVAVVLYVRSAPPKDGNLWAGIRASKLIASR